MIYRTRNTQSIHSDEIITETNDCNFSRTLKVIFARNL